MRKWFVMGLLVMLYSAVWAADFSGSWVLNVDESQMGEGRFGRMAALKLEVVQNEETIQLSRTFTGRNGEERTRENEYKLDGSATTESNNRGESTSTVTLKDGILLISTSRTFERDGQTFDSTSEQSWSLSKDGQQLTVESKFESPRGVRELKLIYDKN